MGKAQSKPGENPQPGQASAAPSVPFSLNPMHIINSKSTTNANAQMGSKGKPLGPTESSLGQNGKPLGLAAQVGPVKQNGTVGGSRKKKMKRVKRNKTNKYKKYKK